MPCRDPGRPQRRWWDVCEGEGEGEKFLMGIMTACHADPGLHPCVLARDA
jgi:hypothetical protein